MSLQKISTNTQGKISRINGANKRVNQESVNSKYISAKKMKAQAHGAESTNTPDQMTYQITDMKSLSERRSTLEEMLSPPHSQTDDDLFRVSDFKKINPLLQDKEKLNLESEIKIEIKSLKQQQGKAFPKTKHLNPQENCNRDDLKNFSRLSKLPIDRKFKTLQSSALQSPICKQSFSQLHKSMMKIQKSNYKTEQILFDMRQTMKAVLSEKPTLQSELRNLQRLQKIKESIQKMSQRINQMPASNFQNSKEHEIDQNQFEQDCEDNENYYSSSRLTSLQEKYISSQKESQEVQASKSISLRINNQIVRLPRDQSYVQKFLNHTPYSKNQNKDIPVIDLDLSKQKLMAKIRLDQISEKIKNLERKQNERAKTNCGISQKTQYFGYNVYEDKQNQLINQKMIYKRMKLPQKIRTHKQLNPIKTIDLEMKQRLRTKEIIRLQVFKDQDVINKCKTVLKKTKSKNEQNCQMIDDDMESTPSLIEYEQNNLMKNVLKLHSQMMQKKKQSRKNDEKSFFV